MGRAFGGGRRTRGTEWDGWIAAARSSTAARSSRQPVKGVPEVTGSEPVGRLCQTPWGCVLSEDGLPAFHRNALQFIRTASSGPVSRACYTLFTTNKRQVDDHG